MRLYQSDNIRPLRFCGRKIIKNFICIIINFI
nr:MAG TPA_asm: hypothetical protein [Bacteriophage sp.]